MASTLTYSLFTPPRIRRALIMGSETRVEQGETTSGAVAETVYLKKLAITDLRNDRNTPGYRRVRFLLSAFMIREPETMRPLIEHFIRTIPRHRPVPQKRVGKKRTRDIAPVNPASAASNGASSGSGITNKRLNTGQNPEPVNEDGKNSTNATETGKSSLSGAPAARSHTDTPSTQETTSKSPTSPATTNTTVSPGQSSPSDTTPRNEPLKTMRRNTGSGSDAAQTRRHNTFLYTAGREEDNPSTTPQRSVSEGLLNNNKELSNNEEEGSSSDEEVQPIVGGIQSVARVETRAGAAIQTEKGNKDDDYDSIDELCNYEEDDPDEDYSDIEHPNAGPIKCGAVMKCLWVFNSSMQRIEEMESKCKKCRIPMHKKCAGPNRICSRCLKKKAFSAIFETEREWRE